MNSSLAVAFRKCALLLLVLAGVLWLGVMGATAARATQSLTLSSPQGYLYAGETISFKVTGDNLRRVSLKIYRLKGTSRVAAGSGARTPVLAQTLNSSASRSQMVFKIKAPSVGWYQAEARAGDSKTAFDEVTFSLGKRPVSRRESRDNRQAWFVNYLPSDNSGRYYLRYILRPEQPGNRVAPPARIEAMYRPDFNGHSSETVVEVK